MLCCMLCSAVLGATRHLLAIDPAVAGGLRYSHLYYSTQLLFTASLLTGGLASGSDDIAEDAKYALELRIKLPNMGLASASEHLSLILQVRPRAKGVARRVLWFRV